MTEAEKQVISKLREIIEYDKKHRIETIYDKEQIEFRNNIELVLDLIEKQKCELEINEANLKGYSRQVQKDDEKIEKLQKENEELKNKVVKRDNEIIQLEESAEKEFLTKQEVKENYIPKDKIRELLENNYDISTENSRSISVEGAFGFVEDIEELLEEE